MGTAVLHPQDYLAAPQSDRNYQFLRVADCPSPAARPNGRAFPAVYEASIPVTERGRHVASCNKIPSLGRSLLSRNNSSEGLLPLPGQALQGAHNINRRLVPRISACGLRGVGDSYGIQHSVPSHRTSNASDVCISRRSSVPMLDHATRSQKFLPEHFPLHGVQLHERRPLQHDARFPSNSTLGMPSCAGGAAISCQKLKFLANSHFYDVLNPVRLKRADSFDQSVHYRKRTHPELCPVEVCLGRQWAKPRFKVLPDGQGKSICTNMRIVGRKFNVRKQLGRSASEKVQERSETPNLQRSASKDGGEKLVTSLSEGVVGSHTGRSGSSKIELKLTSSAPPLASSGRKIEKGPQMQVSLDVDTRGRMCGANASTVRSSRATLSQQLVAMEHKESNVMEPNDVYHQDRMTVRADSAPQVKDDLRKVDVTSIFNNLSAGSNIRRPQTAIGSEGMSRGHSSALDNDETWVSLINDERWAGPSFYNSPSPSSLPVPSFTFLFSRAPSTGSKPTNNADYSAHMVSNKSSLQASCTWDVAFATKDLRRMLNLDNASFNL